MDDVERDIEEGEEPEYLDDVEKVAELEDDQGFGGEPPQTFPGQEVEEEEDEAPVVGWEPEEGASDG